MHNVHPFREAADCDKKKITERVLDKNEQDLLKATPAHLVSDVNKDELQKRVSMCFVLEMVFYKYIYVGSGITTSAFSC